MTILSLQARDYLDDVPLPNLDLEVVLTVVATWRRLVPDIDVSDDFQDDLPTPPVFLAARGPGGRVFEEERDSEALEPEPGVTDGFGRAVFEWPYAPGAPLFEAFRRMRLQRPGVSAVSVFAEFGVRSALGGRIDSTSLPDRAGEQDVVAAQVVFDLAETIVGHTTETTAKLWFRSHVEPLPDDFRALCEVYPRRGRETGPAVFSEDMRFDPLWADTATVEVTGLEPETDYEYVLARVSPEGTFLRMAGGSFRTAAVAPTVLSVAFASCHQPTGTADSLDRWQELEESSPRHDLLLLMGDQIYGDRVAKPAPNSSDIWFDRYAAQYQRYWRYRPVRDALRHHPTYMMLDDHDVADDWGITFAADTIGSADDQRRVFAGLRAYAACQQAHGPRGLDKENWASTDAVDYAFRRGPVAFYVLDDRTQRGRPAAGTPVLGTGQLDRLRDWAFRGDAQTADVVVLVAPVPLAVGNTERVAAMIKDPWGKGGTELVARLVQEYAPGGRLLRPAVSALGWFLSLSPVGILGQILVEEDALGPIRIRDGEVIEPDLADQWNDKDNRPDLTAVLDVLFDLANDTGNQGARPRVVIVLGGDIHSGGIHRITSSSPRHRAIPEIWQFVSSPVSHEPTSMNELFRIAGGNRFHLAFSSDGEYRAEWAVAPLGERNYGSLLINRVDPQRRRYWLTVVIRGQDDYLLKELAFDLENPGPPVSPWPQAPIGRLIRDTRRHPL